MAGSESSSSSSGTGVVGQLRAAMRAGWWTLLIGALYITVAWLIRAAVVGWELTWVARLWGTSIEEVARIWLGAIFLCKLMLFLCFLACIFLTILVREQSR